MAQKKAMNVKAMTKGSIAEALSTSTDMKKVAIAGVREENEKVKSEETKVEAPKELLEDDTKDIKEESKSLQGEPESEQEKKETKSETEEKAEGQNNPGDYKAPEASVPTVIQRWICGSTMRGSRYAGDGRDGTTEVG